MSHNPAPPLDPSLPVVLMTRPQAASERVIAQLKARRLLFSPVISPLIGIETRGPLPDLSQVRGLIFTSANGVNAYISLNGRLDLPCYCVGTATTRAAQSAGLQAFNAHGNADDLVQALVARSPAQPLMHVRGQHTRGDVAERLSRAGLSTHEATIYDQPECPLSNAAHDAISGKIPVIAPLFSPRTAAILATYPIKAPFLVAALSQAVANASLPLHKQRLRVAARPESDLMLDIIAELVERAREGLS